MIKRWNRDFTDLIRANRSFLWGNWSLDTGLEVGALVQMNPATGEFNLIGETLPNVEVLPGEVVGGHKWNMKSEGVSEDSTDLGGDVTSGEVEASTNLKWTFTEKYQMASCFGETREPAMKNVVAQLKENKDWLIEQARRINLYTDEYGIEQGFCVVTKVIYAKGGVNLASQSESSTFSLDVSAGMTDGSGNAKAGYCHKKTDGSVLDNKWPESPDVYSDEEVVVAFKTASFTGKEIDIIPQWSRNMNFLSVKVKNTYGSLIIYAKLIYELDGEVKTEKLDHDWGISVWYSAQGHIPLTAKNVRLHLTYDDSEGSHYDTRTWADPLSEWPWGKYILEVGGWVDDIGDVKVTEKFE